MINYEWERSFQLLAAAENCYPEDLYGKQIYQEEFEKNKGNWAQFFDDDLRIRIDVDASEDSLTMTDIKAILNEWHSEKARKLFNKKDKFNDLDYAGTNAAMEFLKDVFKETFTVEEILDGKLQKELLYPNDKERIFNKGTKLSKYLKALVLAEDKRLFDKTSPWYYRKYKIEDKKLVVDLILDLYSQILSSVKNVSGTVVLSMNPLDFIMVSSHTDGGWDSCHHYDYGEYKTGGLSHAIDEVSLVAYAYKKEKTYIHGEFEDVLPLKLWRQMVYIHPKSKSAYISREYPQSYPMFAKQVRKLTGKLLAEMTNSEPAWYVSTFDTEKEVSVVNNEDSEGISNRIIIYSNTNYNYKDSCTAKIRLKDGGKYLSSIYIGADEMFCIECGKPRVDIGDPQSHLGGCCGPNGAYCSHCDDYIDRDYEEYYERNGEIYCSYCYDDLVTFCDMCEDYHWHEDTRSINVIDEYGDMIVWDICYDCYSDIETCPECGEFYDSEYTDNELDICQSCYDEKIVECHICLDGYLEEECINLNIIDCDGDVINVDVCEDCYENYIKKCKECEKDYDADDCNNDEGYCVNCYEQITENML